MTLALFLSGLELRSNQAVDDLVNQSAILRGNIDIAIQGIGGFITYSPSGQLAPQGVLQAGYITFDNMAAYNDAFIQQRIIFMINNKKHNRTWRMLLVILLKQH